ncbi:MAG TPA: M28 family peptidase [Polyangiaceae bacterium]
MKPLVLDLCSEACAGRAPGTEQSRAARRAITTELRRAGLDPFEQAVPGCNGANVLAVLPGDVDRWVVLGAHYDHLGKIGERVFWGADDNAAAVGILASVASALSARRPAGRGVIVAVFDGEEPPFFLSDGMGSRAFLQRPPVPVETIDFMLCMDLVGHALGSADLPAEVQNTVFALGAERSSGTGQRVDELATRVAGVTVRRADAEVIPPLSDYEPFWRSQIPFLFLTCGRSRVYHTPEDTPELLAWEKMAALASWLEIFTREICRDTRPIAFRNVTDDASTLRSLQALLSPLAPVVEPARLALSKAETLRRVCDAEGSLPPQLRDEARALVAAIEGALA